jgi:hypothetical protein
MVPTDSFNAELVKLVRNMSDDAILALVKNQLGLVTGSTALAALAAKPAPKAAPVKAPAKLAKALAPKPAAKPAPVKVAPVKAAPAKAVKGKKRGRGKLDRSETLAAVERAVKASNGLAASDIAKSTGLPQSRAAAALKELKLAKRIFQGGDRRFARYAADQRTADTASLSARKSAGGPAAKK